jgi:asparagine synthetase B (glutamine-hydrolysing)
MTDVPFGVLLSGGLDSSLVASVTKRHLIETEAAEKFGTELHSFVVGLEVSLAGSLDHTTILCICLLFCSYPEIVDC